MRRSMFAVAVLVLAGSLFGCVGREPDYGFLRVHNASTVTINYFYLVPSNSPDWGNDRLGGDLPPNYYFYFSELVPGSYDARAEAVLDSTYYAYFSSIPITAADYSDLYVDDASFTGSLRIVNNTTGAHITGIFIDSGPNQITPGIGPGGSFDLTDLDPGDYNVIVTWDTGAYSPYTATVSSLTLLTVNAS